MSRETKRQQKKKRAAECIKVFLDTTYHFMLGKWYPDIGLCISVGGGIGASCSRQSDPRVDIVKDRVESLEEGLTEDVVQSISTLGANITNNQINVIGGTINSSVLGTRPNLSVTG